MQATRFLRRLLQMENILSQHLRIQIYIFGTTLVRENRFFLSQKLLDRSSVSPLMPLLL